MPKKFKGENSKATVAKARKEAVRLEEKDRKQRAVDDEYWRDDDKANLGKAVRKEDKERKRLDVLDRKKQLNDLLEAENATLKTAKPMVSQKITRHQINSAATIIKKPTSPNVTPVVCDTPLEQNINRITMEEDSARTVHEAISVLNDSMTGTEKHPERRMKAAYLEFSEDLLPQLKLDYPNLRLSQLKQMIKKLWVKSPDNPMNQISIAYNTKR